MLRKLVVGAALAAAGTGVIFGVLPQALASATTTVSEFSLLPGTDPWGTAFDRSGRVWVALPGCDFHPSCDGTPPPGKLALFDPATHAATLVTLPDGFGQPIFVAVDSDGMVWFTMPDADAIGRYNPTSQTFTQWPVPTKGAGPWGIAVAPHNNKIWFTEHFVNKIGVFNPHSQKIHEIATPAVNSNPYGITVDGSNNVWFTENTDSVALIGEFTDQGVLNEYKIRNTDTTGSGLTPHLITIDPATGNPWWSEGFATSVGVLNVAAAQPGTNKGVVEYKYSCDFCGHTSGISIHNGEVWLDDSVQNKFGSISTSGGSFSFTNLTTQNAHPHDGLNVDAQGRVWFDEEFANNLAVATP